MSRKTIKNHRSPKRPVWQIVTLYVILGVLVYFAVYSLASSRNSPTPEQTYLSQENLPPVDTEYVETIISSNSSSEKGEFLTDSQGLTLYVFDNDSYENSVCNDECAQTWPPYQPFTENVTIPEGVTTFTRTDGSLQYAYRGMPLYYYIEDEFPLDMMGDGKNGLWHIISL